MLPDDRRLGLSVLLTGKPNPNDPSVDAMLGYASTSGYNLEQLWVAIDKNGSSQAVRYAALVIPAAGRSSMLFMSPLVEKSAQPVMAALVKTLLASQSPGKTIMLQTLLDPGQTIAKQAALDAGFIDLAELMYMQKRLDTSLGLSQMPLADQNITAIHWQDKHHDLFARAISSSYIDTQDCPGLLGIRPINDVLAGHKATGIFTPNLWHVFYQENDPVAVLLLSPLPNNQGCELVYLGLSPNYRGKGYASKILQWGMRLASNANQKKMLLAVDRSNQPALHLYKSLGFAQSGIKDALIYTVKQVEK